MLDSLPSRKHHERDGKEDLAGARETRTIGSGLRGHSDNQIIRTRPAGGPSSRLHDGIIMCLIAPKTDEIFKKSECRHWVPKFDTGC